MSLAGHRARGRHGGAPRRGRCRRDGRAAALIGTWAIAVFVGAAGILAGLGSGTPAGATPVTAPPYLLALGGSASVGFQPTAAHPHGQPTPHGYAEDLVHLERHRWPDLAVVHLGCPGATTAAMLEGGGHCRYPEGDQLDAAQAFLRTHPTTVLVTVDLGFNNLLSCLRHEVVDASCVNVELATVHRQLGQILRGITRAAPNGARIVGVGHYDPYLGDYFRGADGATFAATSLKVMERLDATLRADDAAAGVPFADVASAFDLGDRKHMRWSGLPTVPTDVARTCALTWMCDRPPLGHNLHPDDAGYRAIAAAIAAALEGSSDRAGART